jgi:hypothetical protein
VNYLRTALPWLLFAALAAVSWPASAAAGVLASLAIVRRERRAGTAWEDLILQTGSLAFFVLVLALALAVPHCFLRPYSGAGSQAWLGLVAWFSLAIGKPFTMAFAKQGTPPALWEEPRFKKVNTTITTFWATSFTVFSVLIALAYAATGNSGAAGAVQLIGLAVPGLFTVRYAARARARGAAAAA